MIAGTRKRGATANEKRGPARSVPTGIAGFDQVNSGGLPVRRVTLVLGGAGSRKTIFGMQTLVSAARQFGAPSVFVAFEQSAKQVFDDTASFTWNGAALAPKQLGVADAPLSQSIVNGGDFDILGILGTLGFKARAIGAKRVAFGGLDVLLKGDRAADINGGCVTSARVEATTRLR